jgi:hypothetical protein
VASAITASVWEDRLLSTSSMIRVPVRCAWVATGNNPALSHEMTRRTIRIRLDARVERPWLRAGFKHEPLGEWMREHRAALVHAALTLIQAWIAAGRPEGPSSMGMFERWARVMGISVAGSRVPGYDRVLHDTAGGKVAGGTGWRLAEPAQTPRSGSPNSGPRNGDKRPAGTIPLVWVTGPPLPAHASGSCWSGCGPGVTVGGRRTERVVRIHQRGVKHEHNSGARDR